VNDRAILFVDGNNWYHGLKAAGVRDQLRLDWTRIAQKLVSGRTWLETRYYIGEVKQQGNARLYADHRRFASGFLAADSRHSIHYGRLEQRNVPSEAAAELAEYLGGLRTKIDPVVYKELVALAHRHRQSVVRVEKAVDVMLAVDMVTLCCDKAYDSAYVLSADGDFTHAAAFVRSRGCKVFAVAARNGNQLRNVVNTFIRLDPDWFSSLYKS